MIGFLLNGQKKIIDLIDKPFSIVNINIEDENNRKIELKNK